LIPCPLQRLADRQPAGIFLSTPDQVFTFREVLDKVEEAGEQLLQNRCRLLCLKEPLSQVDTVIQIFAALRQGIPVAPLNLRLPAVVREQQDIWLEEAGGVLPVSGPVPSGWWHPEQTATVLFTSGSTGDQKAVVHQLKHHLAAAAASNAQAALSPSDRWLCVLPLYHVGGLAILFRCLLAGAAVCFPESNQAISQAIQTLHPSHLSLVPTQLYRWLEEKEFSGSGIKRVLMGGAPLSESLRERARSAGLPIAVSYGMTETASQVTATPPGEPAVGSGRCLDHAECRITTDGEIMIKAASTAAGVMHPEGLRPITDAQGWLHTRDAGRIEHGVLVVEGRMDSRFISGGENIQPEVVEQALLNLSGISEAVVVPKEDPEFGQRPVAWVDVEVTQDAVTMWNDGLRAHLPGYMIPVAYRRLPEGSGLKRSRAELISMT
jgi:O-succinylbenzoic acid--CoA ligase